MRHTFSTQRSKGTDEYAWVKTRVKGIIGVFFHTKSGKRPSDKEVKRSVLKATGKLNVKWGEPQISPDEEVIFIPVQFSENMEDASHGPVSDHWEKTLITEMVNSNLVQDLRDIGNRLKDILPPHIEWAETVFHLHHTMTT